MDLTRVNDIPWERFLRLRDDEAKAMFFVDQAIVFGNINSNSINGLDFDKEVLVSGPDQTIQGKIKNLICSKLIKKPSRTINLL